MRNSVRCFSISLSFLLLLAPAVSAQDDRIFLRYDNQNFDRFFSENVPTARIELTLRSRAERHRTDYQRFSIALGFSKINQPPFRNNNGDFKDLVELKQDFNGTAEFTVNGKPYTEVAESLGLSEQERRRKARRKGWLIGGGVVVVALIAGAVIITKAIERDNRTD